MIYVLDARRSAEEAARACGVNLFETCPAAQLRALRATPDECVRGYTQGIALSPSATCNVVTIRLASELSCDRFLPCKI